MFVEQTKLLTTLYIITPKILLLRKPINKGFCYVFGRKTPKTDFIYYVGIDSQMNKRLKKLGQMNNLQNLVIGIAVLAIVLVVVFVLMSELASNTTVATDQNASAAIDQLQSATDDVPGWVPIIVIVSIGSIILGMITLFRAR